MKANHNSLSRVMKTIMANRAAAGRTPHPAATPRRSRSVAASSSTASGNTGQRRRRHVLFRCRGRELEKFLDSLTRRSRRTKSRSTNSSGCRATTRRKALARWEEIKAAARDDIGNGWHAARGVAQAAAGTGLATSPSASSSARRSRRGPASNRCSSTRWPSTKCSPVAGGSIAGPPLARRQGSRAGIPRPGGHHSDPRPPAEALPVRPADAARPATGQARGRCPQSWSTTAQAAARAANGGTGSPDEEESP